MIVRKLEYLAALAKEKHFARAAQACHVSQPTLSAGIQQLETELGVQIVKRGRRFQGFTEPGELVLSWALQTIKDAEALRQKLKHQQAASSGPLRVGVLGSTIPLIKLFTEPFHERFPDVSLRVTIQDAFETQQSIDEGSIDVAITYLDRNSRHYARWQALYVEEYELLIRRGTRFSGNATARWEDIKELPLCLLFPDMRIFGTEESEILNEALTKTTHITTSAIWLVMDHVRSGKWASVLPRPVRAMIANDPELEAIPLPSKGKQPTVGIALPRGEPRSRLADSFFDMATSSQSLKLIEMLLRSSRATTLTPIRRNNTVRMNAR